MRPRLRNLGVRARLTGGFVLVCALIGALDCVGITGLQRVQRTYAFAEHEYAWACAAHRAKTALLEEVWAQKNYVLRGEKTDLRLTRERAAMVDARRAQLADLTAHPSDEAALQRLDEQIAVLRAVFERAAVVRKAKGTRAADALVRGRAAAALIALDPSITSAEQRAAAAALTAANVSDRTFLWTTLIVISVAVFAVAVGIGLSARQHAEWSATEASIDERNMEARLPPQVETALYRIAQEALANVAKHADAEHVWIELTRDGDEVTLVVRDDGRGMDVAALSGDKAAASGLGLLSMAQRAQELGGDLQLESAPGKGTTIRVHISVGEAK